MAKKHKNPLDTILLSKIYLSGRHGAVDDSRRESVLSGRHTKEIRVSHPPGMKPQDWAQFIELKPFERAWRKLGLGENDREALHLFIMLNPAVAPIIVGTGGARKMRFSSDQWNVGKRKGARVIYAYYPEYSVVLLMSIYMKGRKEDVTNEERKLIKGFLEEFEASLKKGVINV